MMTNQAHLPPKPTILVPGRSLIMTIPDVLSPAECAAYAAESETQGYEAAPITTLTGFVMRTDIRNNTRIIRDDAELAVWLWQRVEGSIPAHWASGWHAVGLNERFRFYRYDPGQYFRWHHDGAFIRSADERSMLTLMLYLNEGFSGGDTEFDHEDGLIRVVPRQGMALIFAHHQRHQGAPVRHGRKYVMRTDVMYRRTSP